MARAAVFKWMDLSDPDDMANRLETWVEKLGETPEGKAALDNVGLFIEPESEEDQE
jgi:hypothetical protein